MLILAARHGETELTGHCRGRRTDCALSPDGIAQTESNLRAMAVRGVRILYTSTLKRARYAGVLAAQQEMEPFVDPDLDAIDAGEWEALSWKTIAERWPKELRHCDEDARSLVIPGGRETIEVFEERVLRAIDRIVTTHRTHHAVVGIVTHGCVLGIARGHMEGATSMVLRDREIPTGTLVGMQVEGSGQDRRLFAKGISRPVLG